MNNQFEESIKRHPFFHGMKPNHLAMLRHGATEATYKAGEILFKEGEPANRMFLVESGEVMLEAHEPGTGSAEVQTVGEGDVLGWSWLFPPFTWNLRARALAPTRVIVLDGAHLLAASEQHHDFGYELMKRVAQIVVHRLQATRKQLLDLENEVALQG